MVGKVMDVQVIYARQHGQLFMVSLISCEGVPGSP